MEIKEYILSVTAATIIGSCIMTLFKDVKVICILCSIFISVAVFKPIVDIKLEYSFADIQVFSEEADKMVEEAFHITEQTQKENIKQNTEAYIYDKASEMGCKIVAEVALADLPPYQPIGLNIKGEVSPYAKNMLQNLFKSELAIPLEAQQWNR